MGLSIGLQAPEFQLTEEESENYAKAIASVARHYDMGASAKTLDWTNLAMTMGAIYGVRVMKIAVRRKAQPRAGAAPGPFAAPAAPGTAPQAPQGEEPASVIDLSLMRGRPN